MAAPAVNPDLIRRIKRVAGRRCGREVEVRWNPMMERWVVYTFDKRTRQVDYPWVVIQHPDGSFMPLDDRAVRAVKRANVDPAKDRKARAREFKAEERKRKRTFWLIKVYGFLSEQVALRKQSGDRSPVLEQRLQDTTDELMELHGSDDALREAAKLLARVFKDSRPSGYRAAPMEGTKLWTPKGAAV